MLLLIKILMVAVAGVMIGMPLFNTRRSLRPALEDLGSTPKETVFTALGEIEFEYRMNKLENEDYEELKNEYQLQALSFLDDEDQKLDLEMDRVLKKHKKKKKD